MDIKKLLKDFGDVAPEVHADALAKEIENKKEAEAVIKPCEKKFYKKVDKKIELPKPKKVEESLNEERTDAKNESVCSKLNRQMHETVDLWDLKSVLNDYECSYVTDLTKDGELFTAWFLHEKDDKGFTGKQIKDEKIYNEVAEKLRKKFPNENIVVTSRQYKYAPEQKAEFMLLLPITGLKEFNNLKPGDKFTMEGYNGTCEVVERTEDGNWECKAPTVGDGWTYFDLYVEDMDKVTLLVDENLNEEWVASGSYIELDIPSEVIDEICHSGSNDEAVAAACAGPLRTQLDAFTDEEIDKAFREIGFDKSEEEINAMTRQEKEHYLVWDLAWSAFDSREMEKSFEDHVEPYGRILDLTANKATRHDELSLNRSARSPIGKLLTKYESISEGAEFDYMLLDRLRMDCDYFLGNGNGYEKNLWAGNVEDQIAKMRELYNKVAEKPEWISMEDIDNYEKEMLAKRDAKNESSDKLVQAVADKRQADFDKALEDELAAKDEVNAEHSRGSQLGTHFSLGRFSKLHKDRLEKQKKLERNKKLVAARNAPKTKNVEVGSNAPVVEGFFTKGELTSLPKKEPAHKVGDKITINGVNGEIIKVKPMKMSDTSTYQIKLDNGKTVWKYEEEINENSDKVYELEDKNGHTIWSHTKRMPGYKWTGKTNVNGEYWNAHGDVPVYESEGREVLPIKFVRVDDWNRPIFKAEGKKYYLSDVNNLFDYGATEEQVKEFYKDKDNLRELITFHGYSVDGEPNGGMLNYDLKLV